jgi:hypothetical protein
MNDERRAPPFHGSGARREGRATNETLASPFLWADDPVDARLLVPSYGLAGHLDQSMSVMGRAPLRHPVPHAVGAIIPP